MKSYIENARKDHQYRLICQYSGVSAKDLDKLVLKNNVVAYGIPKSQALECTWNFRLYLVSGEVLVFSSKCTSVGGWNEVGSLSIDLKANISDLSSDVFIRTEIKNFYISNYSMLVYEEDDVYSESGICFSDDIGAELIVIVAPAPGAVSISIPNVNTELKAEFSMSDYKLKT